MLHYKHSFMLNAIFVTMLYGSGMPILFPICTVSLGCLYMVERLMLAYSYQRPPMYDTRINMGTIELLRYAPLLYAVSSCWMFSN